MSEFLFFERVRAWYETLPNRRLLENYFLRTIQSQTNLPISQLYRAFVDCLLPLLNIPTHPTSAIRELRPLYELNHFIDPYYFTDELMLRELKKCATLSPDHYQKLLPHLKSFFLILDKKEGLERVESWTSSHWKQWYRVFPEGHAWAAKNLLYQQGKLVVNSWPAYRAWYRYTLGTEPLNDAMPEHWEELCEGWATITEYSKMDINGLAELFAGELAHLEVPGFCGDTPNCSQCPLQPECLWHQGDSARIGNEGMAQALQKEKESEATTSDLLGWIFGLSEPEMNLLQQFLPNEKSLRHLDTQSIFEINHAFSKTPYLGEKLKAFVELCKRYNETPLKAGRQFGSSFDIFQHFRFRLRDVKQELFIVVLLDNKHQYLMDLTVTIGTLNKSLVHPREVFSKAIEKRSAAIICVHNHPSGDPKASKQDVEVTRRLKTVGSTIGIPILDHVIIGNDHFFSLADNGLM